MADSTVGSCEDSIASLRELGYAFNESGELRKIDAATGEPGAEPYEFKISEVHSENQDHYEKLANQIPGIVYELLEKQGLKRTYIPIGMPIEKSTFVFTQPQPLQDSKKLIVLIHGSGYVLAGQWARKLIINNSLDHGTQLPYIKRAQKLGYDILVTNTNDNGRTIKNKLHPIKGLEDSFKHANYVFEHIIIPAKPESVAIVAHSFGAMVVRELAENFTDFFKEKVFAIAFTDGFIGHPPASCREYFIDVTRNWVACKDPLDTEKTQGPKGESIPAISAGHPEHEWSSYSAMESVFTYIEEKYEERVRLQATP